MTTCVLPSAERPAVRANGTVSPSLKPMVASEMTRASILKRFFCPIREEFRLSMSVAEELSDALEALLSSTISS